MTRPLIARAGCPVSMEDLSRAAAIVEGHRETSIGPSTIQRRMLVGYSRAKDILSELSVNGLVGAPTADGKYLILRDPEPPPSKLLPCPFCGHESPTKRPNEVECHNCGATGPIDEDAWGTPSDQAGLPCELWNRRAVKP